MYHIILMHHQINYIILSIVLSIIIGGVSYLISAKVAEYDLGSAYECGFEPFEESHRPFTVTFFLVGLLFVLLDIEIIILLPWCTMPDCFLYNFPVMILFFELLLLAYMFEWFRGALKILLR